MVYYGQIVVGPPGSGKTTYCNGMQQYLRLIGREAFVVNLDPANESISSQKCPPTSNDESADDSQSTTILPYETILDVSDEIVNLSSVMSQLGLGPNGGLVYCMEYMEHHLSSMLQILTERLKLDKFKDCSYLLFDFPGQVELHTHSTSVRNIVARLSRELDIRLCAVQLIDAQYCSDPSKFIAASLLSTTTMIRLELPAVNVLSKIDLLNKYGKLPYNLEYFMECQELERLVDYLEGPSLEDKEEMSNNNFNRSYFDDEDYQAARSRKYNSHFLERHRRLHQLMCEVIDDYSLVNFIPLNINDAASVGRVLSKIDRSNGYIFTSVGKDPLINTSAPNMFHCAIQVDQDNRYEQLADIHERYLGTFEEDIKELIPHHK
jgi:GTPase SAR1 family protein